MEISSGTANQGNVLSRPMQALRNLIKILQIYKFQTWLTRADIDRTQTPETSSADFQRIWLRKNTTGVSVDTKRQDLKQACLISAKGISFFLQEQKSLRLMPRH